MTYLYGVDFVCGELIFSCSAEDFDSDYEQKLYGHSYRLVRSGGRARVYLDGVEKFSVDFGVRIVTDTDCKPKSLYGMECEPRDITLTSATQATSRQFCRMRSWYLKQDCAVTSGCGSIVCEQSVC